MRLQHGLIHGLLQLYGPTLHGRQDGPFCRAGGNRRGGIGELRAGHAVADRDHIDGLPGDLFHGDGHVVFIARVPQSPIRHGGEMRGERQRYMVRTRRLPAGPHWSQYPCASRASGPSPQRHVPAADAAAASPIRVARLTPHVSQKWLSFGASAPQFGHCIFDSP